MLFRSEKRRERRYYEDVPWNNRRNDWRDLPERYGPWQTVYSRFRKWMEDGILDNIFRVLSLDAELSELSIDASIVQAHQHSAGAKKGGHPTKSDTVAVEQVQKSTPL